MATHVPSEAGAIVLEVLGCCSFVAALGMNIYLRCIRCRNRNVPNILQDPNFTTFRKVFAGFVSCAALTYLFLFMNLAIFSDHYRWTMGASMGPLISLTVEFIITMSSIYCYPSSNEDSGNCKSEKINPA